MVTTGSTPRERECVRVDGYAPIRDYAVIGNKRTAALVALDGSIDWLALPTFAGSPAFDALLDAPAGGRFTLAPVAPFRAARRYVPDTNVLETTYTTADGSVRVTDAMSRPIAHGLLFNQVIRRVDGLSGTVPMAWAMTPRFGDGRERGRLEHHAGTPTFHHGHDVLALQVHGAGDPQPTPGADGLTGAFACRDGDVALLALSAFRSEPISLQDRDRLLAHLDGTVEYWRRWLSECDYDGPWRDAVRRSALALDLLVEDQTGAIAAAATMGLPERIGGPRNYDYRYAWVRDANLTLEAFLRLGYRDQVHISLGWMLETVSRTHPRLRPMYTLDGNPRLPDESLSLPGYRHSAPVTLGNSAQDQLQLGNYGDMFDMAWHYVEDGSALHPDSAERLAGSADYVCRIWPRPDASIWELGDNRPYTQGKLACWLALERAVDLAGRGQLPDANVEHWRAVRDEIGEYVRTRCWSERRRAYVRAADGEELDASVLLASRGSLVEQEPDRLSSTIDAIRSELGAGGPLLYRYSGMQDEEGAFLACSFWAAEGLARCGRADEGAEMMDALVGLAGPEGLFSEEMDPGTGAFLGNLPQALTHLALVNAASVLAESAASGGPGTS